jgi:hypothetical protein
MAPTARPSVVGLPKAGVLNPLATLTAIFIRVVPVTTRIVPITSGGNSRRSLPISGLITKRSAPPSARAVIDAPRLALLAMATIGPMKIAKMPMTSGSRGPIGPSPSAAISVPIPQPSMQPVIIVARASGGRLRSCATTSGEPTMAVNMTSTCCSPNSPALSGPGLSSSPYWRVMTAFPVGAAWGSSTRRTCVSCTEAIEPPIFAPSQHVDSKLRVGQHRIQ